MSRRKRQSRLTKSSLYEYLFLALITALGLALRIYHLQFYLENGGLDSMFYIDAAVKFSNGDWLARNATFKGPLLTLLLGLFLKIFGSTYIATKFVSLLAGGLLPITTFLLGSELFGKKVGFLSALIVSINPLLIFYHGLVYREALFSFAWTASVYFALRGFKGNVLYSIIGGVFFALSSLTIDLGIFAGIGFVLYVSLDSIVRRNYARKRGRRRKQVLKEKYKNLDIFFFSAFITLAPFIAKNYFTYKDPFVQWQYSLRSLATPSFVRAIMWTYLGLMAISLPLAIMLKKSSIRSILPKQYSLPSSISLHSRAIKISLAALMVVIATFVSIYEFFRGPSLIANSVLGSIKLLESLAFPESLGFLLVFSIVAMVYTLRASRDVALVVLAFVFSIAGLTWGITTHYLTVVGLEFSEILTYYPYSPLDNAFRYVSSFVPLLAVFASYGIFSLAAWPTHKQMGSMKKKKAHMLKNALLSALILAVLFQSVYADALLRVKAQRDFNSLQEKYQSVVNWLSTQGSPVIYSFNPMLKEVYGEDRVVLLTDESLMDIAQRASDEKIEFIVSDILGSYSGAQLALFFGGYYNNPSYVRLNRFSLAKSYKGWPAAQIFAISEVESSQTALVIQHENWGQEWVSFLSQRYLVDSVKDEEDLTLHFSGDYRLIVLTEVKRALTNYELDILRQKVASGVILIVNGLSPAYMSLETNGYWVGATTFVEAPKDAKWNIKFTENALGVSTEIKLNKSYALYSSSLWSSPTGLTGIEDDVVVYATRVEDRAAAIFAKPHDDGVVIFSGVRPSYATAAKDYGTYINFVESLLEKATDKTLFS